MLCNNDLSLRISSLTLLGLIAVTACAVLTITGCGENGDHDDHGDHAHADAGWIEIETRGAASEIIAVWDEQEGWHDGDGDSISALPTPIDDEVEGLQPLIEGGDRASLTVRFFDPDGSEVEMDTLHRDDETGERTCSEYSARYYPVDEETEAIYWGLMRHPDSDNGDAQFVEIDGEPTGIFHCDHVHIYPNEAGSVDVEFVLWHGDHSDAVSDPLTLVVESD